MLIDNMMYFRLLPFPHTINPTRVIRIVDFVRIQKKQKDACVHIYLIHLDRSKDGNVEPQTGSDTNKARHEE